MTHSVHNEWVIFYSEIFLRLLLIRIFCARACDLRVCVARDTACQLRCASRVRLYVRACVYYRGCARAHIARSWREGPLLSSPLVHVIK